ncbi:hypothetical protein [Pseudobutyrivibrio ruminis]|uniref:hypothetical protein n=1 Tax=Pseudobutyrivibrio ruminis TaxID=46206 RepID=UPI00040C47E7|nr:hypothetical protein [Pseudobutyrivibrio ruminis]
MKKKDTASLLMFDVASVLIYIFMMLLLETSVLFCFKINIFWGTMPLACIGAGIVFFALRENSFKRTVYVITFSIIIIILASAISNTYYDRSWDGNAYHKLAVGLLKNGWNPLWEKPSLEISEGIGHTDGNVIWCEGYCKGTWIYAASIYALVHNIEAGKSYTLIGMITVGSLAYYYLNKKKYANKVIIGGTLLLAINPIAMQQMDSFYLDGFLHCMIICLVISLMMMQDNDLFDKKISKSLVFSTMIVCGNIKFTGLLYGGIFCIAFYIYACVNNFRLIGKIDSAIIERTIFYLILAVTTVLWAGNLTYLTNVIRHKTLLYPLLGSDSKDIMSGNSPFLEENHIKNLLVSLFSYTDNMQREADGTIDLKIPFTFSIKRELYSIILPDTRIGGFGIFFSGIFCFAIIGLFIYILKLKKDKDFWLILTVFSCCILLTFGIKESWWARYAPYIYIISVVGVLVLVGSNYKFINKIGFIIMLILLLNNLLPLISLPIDIKKSMTIRSELVEIKAEMPIEVYNDDFPGVYYNFKDSNIKYVINEKLAEEENKQMNYCETLWRTNVNE